MQQTVITATQARDQFADLLNRVRYRGEEFVVQKQGKPAALISGPPRVLPTTTHYTGTDFLMEIAKLGFRGPKDFAKNLDAYAWE